MKYVVELTRRTTAVGHWTIEASSEEEAEKKAEELLKEKDPEEEDVSFGGWEVVRGMTEESDEE